MAPIFVTGDFNAGETNPAITQIDKPTFTVRDSNGSKKTVSLKDSFRQIHPDAKPVGTFNSWRGATTGQKINYVFAMDHFDILSADILRMHRSGRYPSDHFPVMATVAW